MTTKPHAFVPDELARFHCLHCGFGRGHERHAVTVVRNIEEELRVAREALLRLENHHMERVQIALKDQRELVARLEQERMEMRAANVQG